MITNPIYYNASKFEVLLTIVAKTSSSIIYLESLNRNMNDVCTHNLNKKITEGLNVLPNLVIFDIV